MGLYPKYILPRLIDVGCRNKDARELRKQVLPAAKGHVVEVGIGSALNLPYYSSDVVHLYGIDASSELLQMARQKTENAPFPVTLVNQTAEKIPLRSHSVDTVVMTWVLCSIAQDITALQEMKRILKPNGRLIFLEHGLAPEPKIQFWQNHLTPIWKRMGGGCCLNKKIDELISRAGFRITELHTSYMPGPKPMTYVYRGFAQLDRSP
ncbi:MAG: methyltransferase [Acidobacteriaceae bacterium]|nr:methyltransferase [Acidobacteriaceae bacterium]